MKKIMFVALIFAASCSTTYNFNLNDEEVPVAPDYSNPDHWAALPTKVDPADRTPDETVLDNQATARADVFFLHPTIYAGDRSNQPWNGAIDNPKLNKKVDESTILYQASAFNGAGKVYAPRYRQAHLSAYTTPDRQAAERAFTLAYQDVKAAFMYYLEHHNNGRPIIIASHSQGTTHAKTLLREFFDGKPLQQQLVAAYIVGIPVEADYFAMLKPCDSPTETGCFVTWRAWREGYKPSYYEPNNNIVVTNPLTWTRDTTLAPKSLNQGSILRNFNKIHPNLAEAKVHDGLLWLTRPKFPFSFLLKDPNYHIADFNFYYFNVRNNAMERVESYLR